MCSPTFSVVSLVGRIVTDYATLFLGGKQSVLLFLH